MPRVGQSIVNDTFLLKIYLLRMISSYTRNSMWVTPFIFISYSLKHVLKYIWSYWFLLEVAKHECLNIYKLHLWFKQSMLRPYELQAKYVSRKVFKHVFNNSRHECLKSTIYVPMCTFDLLCYYWEGWQAYWSTIHQERYILYAYEEEDTGQMVYYVLM